MEKNKREIERELLEKRRNPWLNKPVSGIDDGDIAELIEAIRDRPAPSQAMNILEHIRLIFKFGMRPGNRKTYGLTGHPIEHLNKDDFGLKKVRRQVLLDDREISAFWAATEALPDACMEIGSTERYDKAATEAAQAAVKKFLTEVFRLN
jgi:hypothetical protein